MCDENGWITFQQGKGAELGETDLLQKVFSNGILLIDQSMDDIRARAAEGLMDNLPTLSWSAPAAAPAEEAAAVSSAGEAKVGGDVAELDARIAAAKEALAALEAERALKQ